MGKNGKMSYEYSQFDDNLKTKRRLRKLSPIKIRWMLKILKKNLKNL